MIGHIRHMLLIEMNVEEARNYIEIVKNPKFDGSGPVREIMEKLETMIQYHNTQDDWI